MGVHGLSSHIKRLDLLKSDNTTTIPQNSTLAIDGNGLIFHLFRLSYHQYTTSIQSKFTSTPSKAYTQQHVNNQVLQSQLLLPSFTPLELLNDVTTQYLTELTTKHGIHLSIYFDGPNQIMKRREKILRKQRREEEWENVRKLCVHGVLPNSDSGKVSKHRSSARRQSREYNRKQRDDANSLDGVGISNNNQEDSLEEIYLSSFPTSPLIMEQIERSIHAFADMSTVLPYGSCTIIQCEGEADGIVAKASASDVNGNTFALGNDTDYLIYGFNDENEDQEVGGETRYIQFNQIDPSNESLCVKGSVLKRSNIAASLSLPSSSAMIELSILLGNDYTGPFVKCENGKVRKRYWESIKWYREEDGEGGDSSAKPKNRKGSSAKHYAESAFQSAPHASALPDISLLFGENSLANELNSAAKIDEVYDESSDGSEDDCERLPPESELSWSDIHGISDHIAQMEGYKLASDDPELNLAIQFSYALYSFGDISAFPSRADDDDESSSDEEEREAENISSSPTLPRGFKISFTNDHPNPCSAALLSLTTYMTEVDFESSELPYLEPRHLDAFLMTLDKMRKSKDEQDMPHRKLQWNDMQALYVMERCLLLAINECRDLMPCEVFNYSLYHSCLESLSFDDSPLDNELVSKHEREFLEEVADEVPAAKEKKQQPVKKIVLPIDEYRDQILGTVQTQRVTIIHGETGCGKSSRVPCMLLRANPPQPTSTAPEVKMIVSQPRRIAAKALAERIRSCEPDIAPKIALRMGHGVKEHETSKTRAWFVTTGYVVRLLANHPGWFDSHTHLIIDEVHERSIDTDILCLLCRRLLKSHPTIRLVLMSATLAAELYSQYFGSPEPPIHVGARRFPIKEYFVEDLSSQLSLSAKGSKNAKDIYNQCEKDKCSSAPAANNMEKLYYLAAQITASVGTHGSSVLIFVPGMSDIEAIIELVENLHVRGNTFLCLPIHSDVPFEEQMQAFEPPGEGEVKVIIATNAAESSLTLPDVDHVICLGLCKQIVYNQASHRQMLVPTYISKASATQRAGRTGRVRKGNVYRLYSRNAFLNYMEPFDQGELVRSPLDNTILSLRDMLNEAVTPILLDCLEPPDISNINRSFQSLHASNFISRPSDEGSLTSLGSLVVALGVDLTLGAFVGLGIQFGVAAEAIQLAAILSFPKPPWAISSPMYHDASTFNEIVSKTFHSRNYFDAGTFSEPMGISNLLHDYSECKDRKDFCWKNRVSGTRMKHLYGTVESLKQRVAERLSIGTAVLEMETPPYHMPESKLNILRILQVWLFHDTMIVQNPAKSKVVSFDDGSMSIQLDGPPITKNHLKQILDPDLHPCEIVNKGKIVMNGSFDSTCLDEEWYGSFEIRLVSYALEKDIDFVFYWTESCLKIFVPSLTWNEPKSKLRDTIIQNISVKIEEVCYLSSTGSGNQRGIRGRACGVYHPAKGKSLLSNVESVFITQLSSSNLNKSQFTAFKKLVDNKVAFQVGSILACNVSEFKKNTNFSMTSSGACHQVSTIDLRDLFAAPELLANTSSSTMKQSITFSQVKYDESEEESSNNHPLIDDAPEGGRIMAVLASERRKDNFIRFADGFDEFIDVNLSRSLSINGSNRWTRLGSGGKCYVAENSVPCAVIPTNKKLEIFGCCANTLELRGNACRVEGITLLPQGRWFVGIALLAFGVNPKTMDLIDSSKIDQYINDEEQNDEEKKDDYSYNPPALPSSLQPLKKDEEKKDDYNIDPPPLPSSLLPPPLPSSLKPPPLPPHSSSILPPSQGSSILPSFGGGSILPPLIPSSNGSVLPPPLPTFNGGGLSSILPPSPGKSNNKNTNKNTFEDVWNWIKEKDKFSLGQSPDKYRIKEALKFHSSCMELGEELKVQPESIKALCKLFDGLDGKTMTVWDGYDTSLREANASMRSKPAQKPKTITTYSKSNVEKASSSLPKSKSGSKEYSHLKLLKPSNQAKSRAAAARARAKASQEQEAVTQTLSTNGGGSGKPSKSQKKNAYKTRKERKNTANKSPPTTIETKKSSKKVFLCPSCDERFETQDKCESHIQMCSFGLVKHLKPIVKQDNDAKPAKESKPTSRSSDASQSSNANDSNSKTKKNRKRRDRRNRNKNKGPQQGVEA